MITKTIDNLKDQFSDGIREDSARVENLINERLSNMLNMVSTSGKQTLSKFVDVNEDEILTFIPDRRSFGAIGPALLGVLCLLLLPGYLKLAAVIFFLYAAASLVLGYILQAKVDIPDGFEGVVGKFGKPLPDQVAKPGRNWQLDISKYIPFLVSKRDQVVTTANANFTGDFASILLNKQIVFRVVDSSRFVNNTSPAGIMKLLDLYSSYIALRIITSVEDSRVKFTGRDRLENVVDALNQYLSASYGIEVIRDSLPTVKNDVLEDLEQIRTQLKDIESMTQTKQVTLESAIKAVESQLRTKTKETRSKALELQSAGITLETRVGEQINTRRQQFMIEARQKLEQGVTSLRAEILSYKAKFEKSKAIRESIPALKVGFEMRLARLKQRVLERQIPKHIEVINVEGMGAGVGLSIGQEMFNRVNRLSFKQSKPHVRDLPTTEQVTDALADLAVESAEKFRNR